MTSEEKRKLVIDLSFRFIGLPYIWGGDDPVKGFDCSGFIIELLQSVGVVGSKEDLTADGLMRRFPKAIGSPIPGALVFWGSRSRAVHVEMCLNDELSIGARGGGSETVDLDSAANQNAYIKIRPILSRGEPLGFVDPF